jgi:hypothetical protein
MIPNAIRISPVSAEPKIAHSIAFRGKAWVLSHYS